MSSSFQNKLNHLANWEPPAMWLKIITIDAHAAGEPLRIILSGLPEIKGKTILEKRNFLKENYDYLRTSLMFEPHGHADMYGAIITPPVTKETDFGVIFLHNEGYSTMCGHGIIALTKVVVQTCMIKAEEPTTKIKIDTPAGLVTSFAKVKNGNVESVYFHNVPSFVLAMDERISVPGLGDIKYDIAFGGAFYAFVNADELKIELNENSYRELIEKGMAIKRAVSENYKITHPFEEDLSFLYGTIFIGKPTGKGSNSRNVCIFAEGEVDRSPTGTGVSARMALHYARGELKLNEQIVIESIIGSKFKGLVHEVIKYGPVEAVIPEVEGNAFITGKHEFLIDPEDPLKKGFILR
ncbi:MAG: proline racemase family protein [Ignavibacteriaceae bacterium]|jgi:trans-L-3-hydroxyproline dehydratase